MTRSRLAALLVAAFLSLSALGCSGHAGYGQPPGEAPGADKVVLCHKGKKTLQVAEAAAEAHYRHGDTPGPCGG